MSDRILTSVELIDKQAWGRFVKNHPRGVIFQTPEMFEVYSATVNYEPVVIASYNGQDEINGILVSIIQKEYSGYLGKLTARSIVWGGPLVKDNNPEIVSSVLEAYDQVIREKAIYTQFRNLFDLSEISGSFISKGYHFEEHLNIIINLKLDIEKLWKGVYSKRRNEIRKAEKEGISVSLIEQVDQLKESYAILSEVYKRAKLPIPDYSLFENAFKIMGPKGYIKVYGAFFENKLIGAIYVFTYNGRVYDWYAGSYRDFYSKHPNDLLPWRVFVEAKQDGFDIFDFGGAGKPDVLYRVRDYKEQYGGQFIQPGRFVKIHQQSVYRFSKVAFKLWRKLKSKK